MIFEPNLSEYGVIHTNVTNVDCTDLCRKLGEATAASEFILLSIIIFYCLYMFYLSHEKAYLVIVLGITVIFLLKVFL